MKQSQLDRVFQITDQDVSDELTSTTLTVERDGKFVVLSLFSDYIPDLPGESIILSEKNLILLHKYLSVVLDIDSF